MNKKELLEKINGDLNELNQAYNNLYHNKVYVIVNNDSGIIEKYYKTKRGATSWISRHENDSYYDDYCQDLVYYHSNCDAYEVWINELINPSNNKMFWYTVWWISNTHGLNIGGKQWNLDKALYQIVLVLAL